MYTGIRQTRFFATMDRFINRRLNIMWVVRAPHILQAIKSTDLSLEIGCGTGNWSTFISPKSKRFIALDIVAERVLATQSVVSQICETPSIFLQASAERLPLANNILDQVICVDVIEHIPNDKRVLQEIARSLKLNGLVLMTTMLKDRPAHIRKFTFDDHLREYEPEHFERLFTEAGLEVTKIFYFYYLFSTLARELEEIICPITNNIPIVGVILRGMLSAIARLDRLVSLGTPSGIGIIARKPQQDS